MNILEYVKTIKKRFTKTDVNAAIDTISAELTNITIPLLTDSAAWLVKDDTVALSTFYRNERDSLMSDFSKSGYLRKSNPLAMLTQSLNNTVNVLSFVKAHLAKQVGDDMSAESVTIAESNALQLVDLAAFVSQYTRVWFDVVLSAEANNRNQVVEKQGLTQAVMVYLGDNRANFGNAVSILATPVDKIEKLFANIPEVVIAEVNPKAIMGTLGNDRVDPLQLNLVQSKWDPIWFISVIHSDFAASRYKTAKEEAAVIELRIARLKKQIEQKDDPRLAQIIERRQGQLDTLRGKMKRMEDSVK